MDTARAVSSLALWYVLAYKPSTWEAEAQEFKVILNYISKGKGSLGHILHLLSDLSSFISVILKITKVQTSSLSFRVQ